MRIEKECFSVKCISIMLFMILMIINTAMAQNATITGKIISSEDGSPVAGATIKNQQSGKSAIADAQGQFSIAAAPNDKLEITSLNFELGHLIIVSGKKQYTVTLRAKENSNLSDVVVIGYGTVKRKDLTGSVGSVIMKDMEKAPVKSFDDALAGRVAGVVVQSGDGQPGSNANIVIRGAGSITQDQSPLYVVDGFPTENAYANTIAPADIESIDVLKDASATAIYGARGANGVILITTKRGKNGPPQISYNGYYGIQAAPKKFDMMGPYDFVSYVQDLGITTIDSAYLGNGITLDDYKSVPKVDVQDRVFRTGNNQNHDVALRGGNNQTRYSLSFNNNDQNGIIIRTGYKRYQGRFTLDQNVTQKLKIGINTNFAYSELLGPTIAQTNFYASSNILYSVWAWRPTNPLTGQYSDINLDDDFYDALTDATGTQDYRVNPYINLQNIQNKSATSNFVVNVYGEYTITPQLKLRIAGGLTQPTVQTTYFNDTLTQSGSKYNATGPNGGISTSTATNWLNENTLTYSNTFNNDHHLTAMIDGSFQINKTSVNGFSANQLPNPDLGLDGLDLAAKANTTTVIMHSSNALVSGLVRINYDYKTKYLLTASMRADGSSKFSKENRWGYFPSAAVAWNFQKENFLNWKALSTGKIRFGVGASGNNRVSDFAYLTTIALTDLGYSYSWGNNTPAYGASVSSAGNSNLKWETSVQTNLGLDLGFFDDRITLTSDVYNRNVSNLILNASLPYDMGVPSATGYKNIGKLNNKGLEITLNTINVKNSKVTWMTNFNIAFNKNTVNSLSEGQSSILSGSGTFFNTTYSALSPYITKVGGPVGQMYGLIFAGVYQYSDFNLMPNGKYVLKNGIPDNGTGRANVKPGDIKYKDINGDGTITNKDWTVIGNGLPKYTGGFSNDIIFANFDLNFLFQWSVGNDVINANRYIFEGGIVSNPNVNQFADYADRWTPTNPSNTMFRAGGFGNAAYSSRVVENGSYLKLRTISLSYNLPTTFLNKLKIKKISIYASAQNIATITGYSGLDPESSSRQSNLTPGFDYAAYPHSLSLVFGINASF